MQKLKDIINNIWTKRIVSLLCTAYAAIVLYFAYMSVFYDIYITRKTPFIWLFVGVSLFFVTLMLYTRKQLWTRILSMAMVPLLLPVFLLNFGEWFLVIPFAVVIIFMFFACGASESTKTVLGTLFLLCYILATIAYFLFHTIFDTSANLDLRDTISSESGKYRANVYIITSTIPNKAQIYIEPNDRDVEHKYFKFVCTGYDKICYTNTAGPEANVEWVIDDDGVERLYLVDNHDKGSLFDAKLDSSFSWSFLIFEFGTEDKEEEYSDSALESGSSNAESEDSSGVPIHDPRPGTSAATTSEVLSSAE